MHGFYGCALSIIGDQSGLARLPTAVTHTTPAAICLWLHVSQYSESSLVGAFRGLLILYSVILVLLWLLFIENVFPKPSNKDGLKTVVTACLIALLLFFLQRRRASVSAVPPWSTRCPPRSWATSCLVGPEAATWPGTTAAARRQRTHAPSNCCSSLAPRASRYEAPQRSTKQSGEIICWWL